VALDAARDVARDAGRDVALVLDTGIGIGPPGGSCGAGCAQIRSQYADAVLRAQRCTVGAANACSMKAPGLLGCGSCMVWVNDTNELAPLLAQWAAMTCDRCFFGGPGGENRCHATGCPNLDFPLCAAAGAGGSCTNRAKDRTCRPGVMSGMACLPDDDYCLGGGHNVCTCQPMTRVWSCA
jgi:hypothetical protein